MTRGMDILVFGTGPAGMTAARIRKRAQPGLSVPAVRRDVKMKLVVEGSRGTVPGAEVVGTQGVDEHLEPIARAMQKRLGTAELAMLNHCAHPVQSNEPAHKPIVMAAEATLAEVSVAQLLGGAASHAS